MMILVNGGSSSGKSAFAESLIVKQAEKDRQETEKKAQNTGEMQKPSWYLATMIAWDEECRDRIRKHRAMRAEKNFRTIEAPVDIGNADVPENSLVLLECLSNLAANEMYREDVLNPEENAENRIIEGIKIIQKKARLLVIVTNDVSGDQGSYSEETERYRKMLGSVNISLAAQADEVYEVFGGIPVQIKGTRETEKLRTGENIENMEKQTRGITLFTGGAHQGKTELALRAAKEKREDKFICVADGAVQSEKEAFHAEAILNLHLYIRKMIEDFSWDLTEANGMRGAEEILEQRMYHFLDAIIEQNPDAVITCDEIGCGIVPVEKKDRLWREMTGDACQYLAVRAKRVSRVVCGIEMALKGGEV